MQVIFALLKGRICMKGTVCKVYLQYYTDEFARFVCNIQRESLLSIFAISNRRVCKIYLQYQKGDCKVDLQYLKGEFVRIVCNI